MAAYIILASTICAVLPISSPLLPASKANIMCTWANFSQTQMKKCLGEGPYFSQCVGANTTFVAQINILGLFKFLL
jgi:hypothetical protein